MRMDYERFGLEAAQRLAAERGLEVVPAEAEELQVDIDSAEDLARFEHNLRVLKKYRSVHSVDRRPSPGGAEDHWHISVFLTEEVEPLERIALQACLGSDRMRELLSVVGVTKYALPVPTLFFEKPEYAAGRKERRFIFDEDEEGANATT